MQFKRGTSGPVRRGMGSLHRREREVLRVLFVAEAFSVSRGVVVKFVEPRYKRGSGYSSRALAARRRGVDGVSLRLPLSSALSIIYGMYGLSRVCTVHFWRKWFIRE